MSSTHTRIESPEDAALGDLCQQLRERTDQLDGTTTWPAEQLRWCSQSGVYEWFTTRQWGGQQWSEEQLVQGYLALSAACLTTTFILTQRTGASQRIERSENEWVKEKLLPGLLRGELFATLGISHLTTSRRHLDTPVMQAVEHGDGFLLNGYSPWVTGASEADVVVLGATLNDGQQIMVALPTKLAGVEMPPPAVLTALSASRTGRLECHNTYVGREWLLSGPAHDVAKRPLGARTGGLQTSTLAVGLAQSAIEFLDQQAEQRSDLADPANALRADWLKLRDDLLRAAANDPTCSEADLRSRANSLVLRASQSALAAAKGAGYVMGHPANRWCREALFFLVLSCPQPVVTANLCEFAGIL